MNKKIQSLVKEWFDFAENDYEVARKIYKKFNHITCFHCQQSSEKYIKGLLVLLQKDFKKSHNLTYLLELLAQDIPDNKSGVFPQLSQKENPNHIVENHDLSFSNLLNYEMQLRKYS